MRGDRVFLWGRLVVLSCVALITFLPLARGSDAYLGVYNTLVRILADRCLAVGVTTNDIPQLDPTTHVLTQTRLNTLRSKVLSLIDTKYLVPPEFFALDKASPTEAFYCSRAKLMAGIGDGRRFTKVPAEYTSDGVAIYAESFTDVPPLWTHFAELHEAMLRLRFTLTMCVWTNFDGSSYHDNGQGCTWQGANTWERTMQLADEAYAADEPGVAQGNPRSITRGYVTGSNPYVYYADRSRAYFFAKVAGLPTICPRRVYFYNYATKPDPKWAGGMPIYQQFSNAGEPRVRENFWTPWHSTDTTSSPDVYSGSLGEAAYADWCQKPDIARRYSHSGFLVADKRAVIEWLFETPPLINPCIEDSECDGVTVDSCECQECLPEPHVGWTGPGLGVAATVQLGRSDGATTAGLQIGANLTEYIVAGRLRQMLNLETRVLARAVDPGGKWEFVQIKRPAGTEVVFALKGSRAGWPVGMTKAYRLIKSGSDYELHFGGPSQIVHRFDGASGQLKEVRAVMEHQPVGIQGGPDSWPGLTLHRTGGKITSVEWVGGLTELALDENGYISSVTFRDQFGAVSRRITMTGTQNERWYGSYSGADEFITETRLRMEGTHALELWRGVSEEGEPLWRQRREAFEDDAGKLQAIEETTTITAAAPWVTSVSPRRYVFESFPWGSEVTDLIEGGAAAQPYVTTWEYYTDPGDSANYGRMKLVQYPNGRWVRYEYDSHGRLKTVYAPFKNARPEDGPEACRVRRYYYARDAVLSGLGFPAEDVEAPNDRRPRLEVEEVQGHEVARTYHAYLPDRHVVQRCLEAGARYDSTNNATTVTSVYLTGLWAGRPRQVVHPDRTVSVYQYQYDPERRQVVETRRRGMAAGQDVTNGVETVRILDAMGQVVSQTQRDIASAIVISSLVYTRDMFGRETVISNVLDGTCRETRYGCCGPELSIDEDGVQTWLSYDRLGRECSMTRLDLREDYVHDVFENIVETRKSAPGGLTSISRMTFDKANRLVSVSNELGGVTCYSYLAGPEGERTTVATMPNGAMAVETRFRDGQLKSRTGSAVTPVCWDYGADAEGLYTIEYRGADTNATEWVRTHFDRLGRLAKVVYPDGYARQFEYDAAGRLRKESDGFVTRFLAYDEQGRLRQEAVDMDNNGRVDPDGADVIEERAVRYRIEKGRPVQETLEWVYPDTGSSNRRLAQGRRVALDGSGWELVSFGRTNRLEITRDRAAHRRTETAVAPDGTSTVNTHSNGLLVATRTFSAAGELTWEIRRAYDGFSRLSLSRELAANGEERTTRYAYDPADNLTNIVISAGETARRITSYCYDQMGWLRRTVLPEGGVILYDYDTRGNRTAESGAGTYPVRYEYDEQGRLVALSTFRNGPGGEPDTTGWSYDLRRGWLTSKRYADGAEVQYEYRKDGRVVRRRWARGVVTSYGYDAAGHVTNMVYSDSTPAVSLRYERLGRLVEVQDGAGGHALTYGPDGQLAAVTCGHLPGLKLEKLQDSVGRLSTIRLNTEEGIWAESGYGYDPAGRLAAVSNALIRAVYQYAANGRSVSQRQLDGFGGQILGVTYSYDVFDRLVSVHTEGRSGQLASATYSWNLADQRTETRHGDGSFWRYGYDELGQLVTARRYHADGTVMGGAQFDYQYDTIGNRKKARSYTGSKGGTAHYLVNELNQYQRVNNPGIVWVSGLADNESVVTVGTPLARARLANRHGEYFWCAMEVDNSHGAVWLTNIVRAIRAQGNTSLVSTELREAVVRPGTEELTYDGDGNLAADGLFHYQWDGENRLGEVVARETVPPEKKVRCRFTYDYMGRRLKKEVYRFASGQWVGVSTNLYLYDGWLPVVEIEHAAQGSRTNLYLWGLDVSGSIAGAGGIGGLLATVTFSVATNAAVFIPCYDGHGHVVGLTDCHGTNLLAVYDYGPFGEPLRATEPPGFSNPFRFSTKQFDSETGLYYFGYRYYSPTLGRCLSRDPAEETAGPNLYTYVNNDPVDAHDSLGQWSDHATITEETFSELQLMASDRCKKRILARVKEANVEQDSVFGSLWDNSRHFNRAPNEPRREALEAYISYLEKEKQLFREAVKGKTSTDCKEALAALGRLTHSWQDFFAHAYHEELGWNAWEKRRSATPTVPQDFFPSSYPGEHPLFGEPIEEGTPEYNFRRRAAIDYVRENLQLHLEEWLRNTICRKACETACWF